MFKKKLDQWERENRGNGDVTEASKRILEAYKYNQTDLNLSVLGLSSIPDCICELKVVKTLHLRGNRLTRLPHSFGNLRALENLDLRGNQLAELPDSFVNLTALGTLYLGRNRLTRLPDSFGELTALQKLYLNGNQLQQLPDSFVNLTALESLDLSGNQLERLPDSFGNLARLRILELNQNQLEQLPDSFGNLTALQTLRLAGNPLIRLPDSFGNLQNLRFTDFDRNGGPNPRQPDPFPLQHNQFEATINKDDLKQDPLKVLRGLQEAISQGHFPRITFLNDIAIDAGGLSRIVVSDLMKALFSRGSPLLLRISSEGATPLMRAERDKADYRAVGAILATAFNGIKEITTGKHFHPIVFQLIHSLTQEEMERIPREVNEFEAIPEDIRKKLLKLYCKSLTPGMGGDEKKPNDEIDRLIHTLNEETKRFIIDEEIDKALHAVTILAKSLYELTITPERWDIAKGDSPERLADKIEGSLSKEQVTASLNLPRENQVLRGYLETWINAAEPEMLEKFVYCITGSSTLRAGVRLDVQPYPVSENWPAFHTCSFQIDVPEYPDYETFKSKLERSIEAVVEGNETGLA